MKINELRLKDILKDYDVREQEFEYAEVPGIAEIFAYHIVFFRSQKNLRNTVAIYFQLQEIEDTLRIHVVHVANLVLKAMGINVKFGETTIEEINSIYGTADFMYDPWMYDSVTYHYLINSDLLMAFTITGKVLLGLEIFADEEMVKGIVDYRRLDAI